MPFELIKTNVRERKETGRGQTQVLVEGDVIVPDVKNDIMELMKVQGSCYLTEEKPLEDKIGVKGCLRIEILYAAKKSEKPVHSMTEDINFEDFINVDNVTRQSDISASCRLEHLEYRLINDRKIGVKAIVALDAAVWESNVSEVASDASGDGLQLKYSTLAMAADTEIKKDTFNIRDQFAIDRTKPDIGEILQCDTTISQKELKAVKGGVSIKAEAVISLLYTGIDDESAVEACEFYMPVSGTVEIPEVSDDMLPFGKITVEKTECFAVPNSEGEDRIADVEIIIQASCGARGCENVEYIEDAYSIAVPVKVQKEEMEYGVHVGSNTAKTFIKDAVPVERDNPDIMQVIKCWGTVSPDPARVEDGSVIVEGGLKVSMLYIAKDDSTPVSALEFMVPFEQVIDIPPAREGDMADAETWVDRISVNMLSGREVEVSAAIVTEVNVNRIENASIVVDIAPDDECDGIKTASVVIYVVQSGDSLWKIAKKFNTTVENILMVNDIENPDKIFPGQKILILKTI
ncbi:MAG: DUF3794 domain-containing protein [Firmicutes bacterium]|nr:DUF3794 domain-containing protein [Bacillota bacterium]